MAKNTDAKCKLCRRAGEKLYLKGERCATPKCSAVKRNFPPGFHGSKMRRRMTDYGLQLNEKQKAKRQYNMREKQFRLTFDKARKKTGNTGDNFLKLLEARFDNVVYRAGIASSRAQSRQMINHGLFIINEQKVNIPSYSVKSGDVIKVKNNKKEAKIFKILTEKLKKFEAPGWLNLNAAELSIKILHMPDTNAMKPNFNMQMLIEYYSK